MAYAEKTSVSIIKSKGEIEAMVSKAGATGFMSGTIDHQSVVAFELANRRIMFRITMPPIGDYSKTPTRKRRTPKQTYDHWEQAQRSKWRQLYLVIKAKLEAVESGISVFDEEFLAHIVVPGTNGQTVGDRMLPGIEKAYQTGGADLPPLLPGPGGNN